MLLLLFLLRPDSDLAAAAAAAAAAVMDECIRTLSEPKESYNLIVTGNSSTIETRYDPPIYLQKGRSYELALINLETYYSFPNIDGDNNTFRYSADKGVNWKTVTIPIGCYEIYAINTAIESQIPNNAVTVKPNKNTLQSIMTIATNYLVDFTGPNCLGPVLGFKPQVYKEGVTNSQNIVDILRVNSILVNTNIITGSYLKGKQAPVIFDFFPYVRPGDKIVVAPKNLIYVPVTTNVISLMTCWITDQHHHLINLRGEELTIRFHLRER